MGERYEQHLENQEWEKKGFDRGLKYKTELCKTDCIPRKEHEAFKQKVGEEIEKHKKVHIKHVEAADYPICSCSIDGEGYCEVIEVLNEILSSLEKEVGK